MPTSPRAPLSISRTISSRRGFRFPREARRYHPRRRQSDLEAERVFPLRARFPYLSGCALRRPSVLIPRFRGHPNPGTGLVGSVNYTFSPTLVNQATYNWSYNYFSYYEENPAASRPVAGQWNNRDPTEPDSRFRVCSRFMLWGPGPGGDLLEGPASCSNGYCPLVFRGFSFGSTPVNAASFGESNVDYVNTNRIYQFSDNLTKNLGPAHDKSLAFTSSAIASYSPAAPPTPEPITSERTSTTR